MTISPHPPPGDRGLQRQRAGGGGGACVPRRGLHRPQGQLRVLQLPEDALQVLGHVHDEARGHAGGTRTLAAVSMATIGFALFLLFGVCACVCENVCVCVYRSDVEHTVVCACPQDSEDLSDEEEEMKIAEMRPPLIEISINQPKVVTLSKDKKGASDIHVYIHVLLPVATLSVRNVLTVSEKICFVKSR